MTSVRLIKHEAVPRCGSVEVRFSEGRPSRYFYWDDEPGRPKQPRDRYQALAQGDPTRCSGNERKPPPRPARPRARRT